MINWFFKYRVPGLGPKTAPPTPTTAPLSTPPAKAGGTGAMPAAPPRPPKHTEADWAPRLQAAMGNHTALLEVLAASPVLAIKLAAVQAMDDEATLKQAERAARNHDRRVHRLAKQRLEAAAAQRQTRARAQVLLDSATALVGDAGVAVNQLVSLDRDWSALDVGLLEPAQAAAFAALREQLAAEARERGDLQQALKRWASDAVRGRDTLRAALTLAANESAVDGLPAAMDAAQALLDSRPGVEATMAAAAGLQSLLNDAAAVQARLLWLAQAESAAEPAAVVEAGRESDREGDREGDGQASGTASGEAGADAGMLAHNAARPGLDADATWAGMPPVGDEALALPLARRFETWQRARAQRNAPPTPPSAAPKPPRTVKAAAPSAEQQSALDELLQQAEAALADGQTGALQQRLQAVEQWLDDAGPLRLSDAFVARWASVQTEGARLKGWQAWGGARARDALVAEAEALARLAATATAETADPEQAKADTDARGETRGDTSSGGKSEAQSEAQNEAPSEDQNEAKGEAQSTADRVARIDAPEDDPPDDTEASKGLPHDEAAPAAAVDPAVAVAAEPQPSAAAASAAPRPRRLKLKAHADAIQSLRQRWKQLDRQGAPAKQAAWARFDAALQAAYVPVAAQHAAQQAARERNLAQRESLLIQLEAEPLPDGSAGPAEWRDIARALDRFQLAWRTLGPLEHTVPSASRGPLQQRLGAAVERIEQPLQAARDAAAARRERLIADAQALVDDSGRSSGGPATARVRELQAWWQDEARALPLARKVETALWARFKAATDAVYAIREAGLAARDAEAAAALAGREAVIARLSALPADAPPAEAERALAEAEREWRQAAELPRGAAAAALDARFADARAALRRHLSEFGRRRWHVECDALITRLSLCEERDDRAAAGRVLSPDEDDLPARWAAAGDLPPSWQQALAKRWADTAGAGPLKAGEVDLHLLQLEAVFDMPASAEQQAARRELKLWALKDAMEGRSRAAEGEAAHHAWLLALLRQGGLSDSQRDRLRRLVAALRESQPGSLAAPPPRR
jgi:hypothetical protein